MAKPLNLSKPHRTIHAGVVLLNSETEILVVAPIDMLSAMSKEFLKHLPFLPEDLKAQALDIEFHWVNESGKTAKLTAGALIQPTDTFSSCPPLDIVLLGAQEYGYAPTEAEFKFMRKSYDDCAAFITVCAGSQAALQAGLLKNKSATAPRFALDQFRQLAPETRWVAERWHRDGKLWTSGALVNGLDLMRAFGTEYWGSGEGTLMQYMLDIGHYPQRDLEYGDATSNL